MRRECVLWILMHRIQKAKCYPMQGYGWKVCEVQCMQHCKSCPSMTTICSWLIRTVDFQPKYETHGSRRSMDFGQTDMNVNGMLKGDLFPRYRNMADLMKAEFQGLQFQLKSTQGTKVIYFQNCKT